MSVFDKGASSPLELRPWLGTTIGESSTAVKFRIGSLWLYGDEHSVGKDGSPISLRSLSSSSVYSDVV